MIHHDSDEYGTDHHGPARLELALLLPPNSLGRDANAVCDIAQAAEEIGCVRLVLPDHVLGAHPERPDGVPWTGAYTHKDVWHEPLVLFGYLAALTREIEFMTGVLVLPQRATALVAKQAAEIDVLSGGRFVLGVGSGWNTVEYDALGRDFHNRGRRLEEQILLLRRLWSEPVVTFPGVHERVTLAGINPLPLGPIEIWMGGSSDAALDRIGRVGDGWFTLLRDPAVVEAGIERIRRAARHAGRDPHHIGLQAPVILNGTVAEQIERARRWQRIGATHVVAVETPSMQTPGELIEALRAFANALDDD